MVRGRRPDQLRALRLLSDFTIFIEHHDAMVRAGLVESLSQALLDRRNDAEVRAVHAVLTASAGLACLPCLERAPRLLVGSQPARPCC